MFLVKINIFSELCIPYLKQWATDAPNQAYAYK